MRLKKLIVHGFKSFADNVEIVFEDGITGVVGPNGCGKSNIADAIKWVLGEQSAKSLRGTKMEDVIFNGTEKRKRLSYCEVTLIFDNEDHALAIDFSEVSVTRRVYRTGEGEYKLNGTSCRLKDVLNLFHDTGIGKDGYSMIGQGRIDEVLSVKSEDRRQIFEEAAGIVKYKVRKTDAQHRMDNTVANLERVEDILTELEERVEPLRQQSEVAREYLALRDELKELDINIFLLRTERYEQRIRELKETLETLTQSIEENTAELDKVSAAREECLARLNALETQTAEKRDALQELIRDVEARDGDVNVLRERITSATREKTRLESELKAASEGREGIAERVRSLTEEIDAEASELEAADAAFADRERALSAAEHELTAVEESAEALKQEIIDAMNRLSDVRAQRSRLGAMKTALTRQIERMETDNEREENGARNLDNRIVELREQLNAENAKRDELRAEAEAHNDRVRALNEQKQDLAQKVSDIRTQRQQADSRLKLLRELQHDYDGYNNSVKQVLIHARKTPGSGVHGIVADLIRVPQRLERAVDMVLGGALQNIVTDRDEDAKRMIDYLRTNRFGRATFLPISAVHGKTLGAGERRLLNMDGCIGVASELIDFDPQYKGIVDSLLGRTVIAEDLDRGIAIQRASGYQLRLVTLEGDVMHSGGSMTGGSAQSRMSSLLSRTREIEETEQTLKRLDDSLSKFSSEFTDIENQHARLKQERFEINEALNEQKVLCGRAEELLNAALEEQTGNNERLERVRGEHRRLIDQLADVEASLSDLDNADAGAEESTEEKQARVRELQEKIYELRTANEKFRGEVTDERVALAERRRDLESKRSERDRLSGQIEDSKQILEASAKALEECNSQMTEYAGQLADAERALAACKTELQSARNAFNETDGARTNTQNELREINERADRLHADLDELNDKKHRGDVQLTRVEGEFKQITDRIWEDYELTYANAESFRKPDFKLSESEKRVAAIRTRIKAMGSVNVSAVDDYRKTVERVSEMTTQRDDLLKARADLDRIIEDLEAKMRTQFTTEFAKINENFQETFTRLFGGGKAELQLSDPKDALNCGIDIVAQPPGKKLQMLSLLSGGERALTAIAILFAILDLKPTPFCVLDEIEAALDDANIDTYAEYLKSYSAKTQFIVITHRKGTMERCNALYGVVMQEKGVSKTVSVKLNEALKEA